MPLGPNDLDMSGGKVVIGALYGTQLSHLNPLSGSLTLYVRTVPATVTMTVATPAVVSWASHGLSVDDPVVFSAPLDRGTCTITIATPGVVTKTAHGYATNDPIKFGSSGTLPTGLTQGTTYFARNVATDTFEVSATSGGVSINTTVSQSGTHYVERATVLPTGVTNGGIYFVIAAGFGANSFQFSSSVAGAAVNTSGSPVGRIVAQTGNNSNTGTAQTRTGATLTLWGAVSQACQYDFNTQNVTIQLADGTYAGTGGTLAITDNGATTNSVAPWRGGGQLSILGNPTNFDAVRIITTGNGSFIVATSAYLTGNLNLQYLRVECGSGGADLIRLIGTGQTRQVFITDINFGAAAGCLVCIGGSGAVSAGNIQFLGDIVSPWIVLTGGQLITAFNNIQTAIGSRTFSGGLYSGADQWGLSSSIINNGSQFVGTMLGPQYRVAYGSHFFNFPFSSFAPTNFPSTMTTGTIGPDGHVWWWDTDTGTRTAQHGIEGATSDIYYSYQIPTNGFSLTIADRRGNYVLDPAGTLATGTITMPANPVEGQMLCIRTSQEITGLTVSPNSGQSVAGNPTTLLAGTSFTAIYRVANTTWYCAK